MQHKLIITIFISLFSFVFTATGQKQVNSPYSRFNLGTLEPAGSFRNLGMGGIGTALRDNSSISFSNPASYSSLDTNSFVFDFGLDWGKSMLTDGSSSYASDDMNFNHLMMGFPLAKGWGVAVGITPLSNGFYKMAESVLANDPTYDPSIGAYTSSHSGDGGFTNLFLGSGININKNLSAGVNLSILFGQVTRLNQYNFISAADFYNVFHDNSNEKLQLGGINFGYGLQYNIPLKNDFFLTAGASLNSGKHYNSKFEHLTIRYTAYGTSDTIAYGSDNLTSAFIPGTLRVGVSFGKKNKLTTGFDFIYTQWSKAKIPGAIGYVADTKSLLFGIEYIPDKFSNYSLIKRIEYRVGAHLGDNYLIINEEQLKEYGASIGIGMPMRRLSKANLYFDYTRKYGPSGGTLFTENYYSLGISLNFYDFWFVKRKYE